MEDNQPLWVQCEGILTAFRVIYHRHCQTIAFVLFTAYIPKEIIDIALP